MVRNYKPRPGSRQYKKHDPEIMKKAYREFIGGESSLAKVAAKYNISKSSLYNRFHYNRTKEMGGQKAFTLEREEHIVKYIHACAPWQYHLQFWDLRVLIKFYLDRRPVITKRKLENNLPGQELVMKLTQRREDIIQQKVIQSITDNGAVTAEAMLSYFRELRMIINDLEPQNIVCFNDVLIVNEFEDNAMKEQENLKIDHTFVMLAATGTGEVLDPFISIKEKSFYEKNPRRSIMSKHSHQERKRLSTSIYDDWFKSIILPYYEGKSGKKCLIGGFFSSRITKDILQICIEQDINFVFLPDNSSHLTQPLHCLTQLIKSTWDSIYSQMKTDSNRYTIPKDGFCEMTESLIANASDTVSEGFEKTGIIPFNPEGVLKQLPDYNETIIEELDEDFKKCDTKVEEETVQVKVEMQWSDQYSDDDDYDHEIASNCIKKKITKEENQDNEMFSGKLEFKISPVDFIEDNEDACADNTQKDMMVNIGSVATSSRGRKLKPKNKRNSSDSDYVPISREKSISKRRVKGKNKSAEEEIDLNKTANKVTSDGIEIDPLSSCQSGSNVQANESHSENGTCIKNTRLLEAILSTVTRQEQLQERATIAMEAQASALTNIAMLLERQASFPRP